MRHVKGPDFPTGAYIVGRAGIRDAYRTGRGRVVMRARAHIEELRGGKSAIIVTELPYGVKKGGESGVIAKIADLVQEKVLTEISDLAGPLRPDRDADPDRAEARRDPAGRAQQALQAHGPADDVRLQRRRARRRRPADALAARAPHGTTSTSSARSSRGARSTSCARRSGARTSSAGYLIALDNLDAVIATDPRRGRHRRGAHGADARASSCREEPGLGDPRPPSPRADGARAQARPGRARRPPGADRRAPGDPRRPGQDRRRRSATSCARSARSTAGRTTAGRRSSRPRRSSSSRT